VAALHFQLIHDLLNVRYGSGDFLRLLALCGVINVALELHDTVVHVNIDVLIVQAGLGERCLQVVLDPAVQGAWLRPPRLLAER